MWLTNRHEFQAYYIPYSYQIERLLCCRLRRLMATKPRSPIPIPYTFHPRIRLYPSLYISQLSLGNPRQVVRIRLDYVGNL